MRVFITGATGFIGRYVMEEVYEAGHDILALTLEKDKIISDHYDIHWLYCDLEELDCIKTAISLFNPDVIIHLVWQGIPDFSEKICQNNLNIAIKFFDLVFDSTNCKKVIVAGSCFEYGTKKGACKEIDKVNINSYFTWAKHSLNQYLSIKCAEKGVILNWFRIFYVYGPGQREGSLIPTLIKSIGHSKTPSINTPMNKNDFVYVGDVATVFTKAVILYLPSGIYNLGSGKSTSVYDVCRIVEKQLLGSSTISQNVLDSGEQTESVNFFADMDKTKKKGINILCGTPIKDGIKKMIEFF